MGFPFAPQHARMLARHSPAIAILPQTDTASLPCHTWCRRMRSIAHLLSPPVTRRPPFVVIYMAERVVARYAGATLSL
jgi:hypothetical protein